MGTKTKIEYTSDTRQVSGKLPRDSEGTSHSASVDDRDLEKVLAASFLGTRALVEFPSDQPRDTEGASRDVKQTSASVFDDDLAHVMAAKYVAKSSGSSEPTNKEERRDPLLRDDNRAQSPPNAREERRDPLLRDDNLVQSPPNAKEERRDEAQAPPKAKEEPPQGARALFWRHRLARDPKEAELETTVICFFLGGLFFLPCDARRRTIRFPFVFCSSCAHLAASPCASVPGQLVPHTEAPTSK